MLTDSWCGPILEAEAVLHHWLTAVASVAWSHSTVSHSGGCSWRANQFDHRFCFWQMLLTSNLCYLLKMNLFDESTGIDRKSGSEKKKKGREKSIKWLHTFLFHFFCWTYFSPDRREWCRIDAPESTFKCSPSKNEREKTHTNQFFFLVFIKCKIWITNN